MGDLLVVIPEGCVEFLEVEKIKNATGLSNTMHTPDRHTNINSLYPSKTCNMGPNRTPSSEILSRHVILHLHLAHLSNLPKNTQPRSISHISLHGINLKCHTSIHLNLVVWLMLFGVVWVDGVGCVR